MINASGSTPWECVYYYFQKWSRDGTIEEIHEVLRKRLRNKRGREESPSVGVIDSQSVKVTKISGECRGIDGGKKIKGRKRHIVTDTQGLLSDHLRGVMTSAGCQRITKERLFARKI